MDMTLPSIHVFLELGKIAIRIPFYRPFVIHVIRTLQAWAGIRTAFLLKAGTNLVNYYTLLFLRYAKLHAKVHRVKIF